MASCNSLATMGRLLPARLDALRPCLASHLVAALVLPAPGPPRWQSQSCRQASSSSASSRWKSRQGRDPFAREAKVLGLKSRAAFKLLEVSALARGGGVR